MSFNSLDLNRALENSKKYLDPPQGYNTPLTSSVADKTIISQNNTIIGLLEIISGKIEDSNKRLNKLEIGKDYSTTLDNIIKKISELSLGKPVQTGNPSRKYVMVKTGASSKKKLS